MSPRGKAGAKVPTTVRVVGHEAPLARVTASLRSGRGAQACLLVGPDSVGKTTAARYLAQWLACTADAALRPCGGCRGCRLTAAGSHPDVCELEPPIKIAAVRELQHRLALAPMESRWHVAILPDIDTASHGACNSMLKTLEEPPSGAMLLLTASDPGAVLPTVRSRCREVRLRPMAVDQAADALVRHWGAANDDAEILARLSAGCLGWAVRALQDPAIREARVEWLDRLDEILPAGPATRYARAEEWSRQADALATGFRTWRSWWRDVLLVQHGQVAAVVNCDRLPSIAAAAERYAPRDAVRVLRTLEAALGRLAHSANPALEATVFVSEMPG